MPGLGAGEFPKLRTSTEYRSLREDDVDDLGSRLDQDGLGLVEARKELCEGMSTYVPFTKGRAREEEDSDMVKVG